MTTRKPFFTEGPANDPIYTSHRDHQNKADLKPQIERMWEQYEPICSDPKKLLRDARDQFVACVWEMYVANVLLEAGFDLAKPPRKGPDIVFEVNGRRFWVEAVTTGPGEGESAVPQRSNEDRRIPHMPEELLILRITNAIDVKMKKYEGYQEVGIISDDDVFVIAVNLSRIRDGDLSDMEVPVILKAVFPIGPGHIKITPYSDEPPKFEFGHRESVTKPSSTEDDSGPPVEVSTALFLEERSASISGIFYSSWGIWFGISPIGKDIVVVHNPMARNPIPRDLFQFGKEHNWYEDGAVQRDKKFKDDKDED